VIIGIISDTHGLLRPEALAALRGSDRIIHAGDIGGPELLASLAALAPLSVVRGNNDRGAWTDAIPTTDVVEADGVSIYVIHNIAELDLDPSAGGFRVVVAGHSHRPLQEERDRVLYFNPGSAGPRRFSLPVAVGRLTIEAGAVRGEIITLNINSNSG
jgi:putative phosphoesterase